MNKINDIFPYIPKNDYPEVVFDGENVGFRNRLKIQHEEEKARLNKDKGLLDPDPVKRMNALSGYPDVRFNED
jgi:hypothetical protein